MGGAFVHPRDWKRISDWDKLHVYLSGRDEEGDHIPLRKRIRRASGESGDIANASRELPSREELGVPDAAWQWGLPVAYILMYFHANRRAGHSTEQIMDGLKRVVKKTPPSGHFA